MLVEATVHSPPARALVSHEKPTGAKCLHKASLWEGKVLHVKEPSEPSQILWWNLHVPNIKRYIKRHPKVRTLQQNTCHLSMRSQMGLHGHDQFGNRRFAFRQFQSPPSVVGH